MKKVKPCGVGLHFLSECKGWSNATPLKMRGWIVLNFSLT